MHSNGGNFRATKMGTVKGYGDVWYNKNSLANILSFANVRKKFPITVSTGPDDPCPTICVHRPNGSMMKFREISLGLYVYDTDQDNNDTNFIVDSTNSINNTTCDYLFLQTVAQNKTHFTPRQIKSANKALILYKRLGRPSQKDFTRYLDMNFIRNTDVTSADAKRAFYIYGQDTAVIQGKTKRTKPNPVPDLPLLPIPDEIIKFHKNITLCMDIFFLNGIAFMHTISKNIGFRTVEPLTSQNYKSLLTSIFNVLNFYQARGFNIEHIRGDHQFDSLREALRPALLHTTAAGEHVPEVERSVQTIECDCRTTYNGLPYKYYPSIMLKSLVRFSIRQRNLFPSVNGVSSTMGPTTILTGLPMPDISYFPLEFGDYVHTHDHPNITNQLTPARSTGAIALGPANQNGGWHFMSLTTGLRILRYKWTVLPVTTDVITRVHELAFPSAANASPPQSLAFTWTDGSAVTPVSPAPEGALNHHTSDHPKISEDPQNEDDTIPSITNNASTTEDVSSRVSDRGLSVQDTSEYDFLNQEYDSFDQDQIKSDLLQNVQNQTDDIDQLEQDFEAEYNNILDNLNAQNYESHNNSDITTDQSSEQQSISGHGLQEQRSETAVDDDEPSISEDQRSEVSSKVYPNEIDNVKQQQSQSHTYNLRNHPS